MLNYGKINIKHEIYIFCFPINQSQIVRPRMLYKKYNVSQENRKINDERNENVNDRVINYGRLNKYVHRSKIN